MPSHLIASSPARCRVVRPTGNLDRGQSFTIWLIVCFAAPQVQDGSGILRQRARFAAHCPWPVLKWFNFVHRCRGKLKPGGTARQTVRQWTLILRYHEGTRQCMLCDRLAYWHDTVVRLSVCDAMIHPTAKVSEPVNRKCPLRNSQLNTTSTSARAPIAATCAHWLSWCRRQRFSRFLTCPITLPRVPCSHCLSSLLYAVTAA